MGPQPTGLRETKRSIHQEIIERRSSGNEAGFLGKLGDVLWLRSDLITRKRAQISGRGGCGEERDSG